MVQGDSQVCGKQGSVIESGVDVCACKVCQQNLTTAHARPSNGFRLYDPTVQVLWFSLGEHGNSNWLLSEEVNLTGEVGNGVG